MLKINDLKAKVGSREVLKGINMHLNDGEMHIIMGPNGSGKSTLCMSIMGNEDVKTSGSVTLDGKDITSLSVDERARLGIFLFFQHPVAVQGVKVKRLFSTIKQGMDMDDIEDVLEKAGLSKGFAERYVNTGFSGGERKKLEMAQLLLMKPKVAILDEPDSGADVDAVKMIAKIVMNMKKKGTAFIIITHQTKITEYLSADKFHVLKHGRIVASGGKELVEEIERKGYEGF